MRYERRLPLLRAGTPALPFSLTKPLSFLPRAHLFSFGALHERFRGRTLREIIDERKMRHNPYPASVLQTTKRSTTPTQPPVAGKWKRAFDMARSGQLSSENNLAGQTAPPAKRMAIGPDENTVTIDDLS